MTTVNAFCLIQGSKFSPALAEKRTGVRFDEKNEPAENGVAGRYRGKPIPYGSATLGLAPGDPGHNLDALLHSLERSLDGLRSAGAEDITVHCTVHYEDQCNFEFS